MDYELDLSNNQPSLTQLANYLLQQRDAILSQWRSRIEAEGEASVLMQASHEEFYNHIPEFLDTLNASFDGTRASSSPDGPAGRHGAQRWRLGMNIKGTTQEWGYLHQVLMSYIASYHDADPSFGFTLLQRAYDLLAEYIHQGISESIAEYHSRYRLEAEARLRDLEAASNQWNDLERRWEDLRQIFHDLNGGLSMIRMAAALLRAQGLSNELIEAVEDIISTTGNMNQLINDLLDLARLEAGRELLDITPFDASEVLRGLCNGMRPMAQEKGLTLIAEGESPLPVRGDLSKVQRVAQNLILNALTYTEVGEVTVGWSSQAPGRWQFYVQDTGPGLPPASAMPLVQGLEEASDGGPADQADATGGAQEPGPTAGGEGIGLVIVHRLCELLECVIEVESEPGQGTTFRITLPADYSEA